MTPSQGFPERGPSAALPLFEAEGDRIKINPPWRRAGFAENDWTFVADDAPTPAEDPLVVSLKRWLAEGDARFRPGTRPGRREAGPERRRRSL